MNPFIPLKRADTVIVAGNISDEIYQSLKIMNLRIIKTIPHRGVHPSIAYHPDIVVHPVNHKLLVVEPSMYDYYKKNFKNTDIEIIKGEKTLESMYPMDIAYNVGRIDNFALHNIKYTDEVLKFYLQKEGLELVNVNQGYTKCSMAIIGLDDIITADKSIHEIVRQLGINSLLIEAGDIFLEHQKYGFIGGCTGNISSKEILFSGSLDNHSDKEKIENFIKSLNKTITYLSKETINDIGSIITLNSNN